MFEPGTKVVLLTSSSNEKYSPRRGSVGYVMPEEDAPLWIYKFLNHSVAVSRIDLLLMRYGFGKERPHPERHIIATLIPFFPTSTPDSVGEEFTKYIKDFHKERKNPKLDYFKHKVGLPPSVPIAIVAPPADSFFNVRAFNSVNFAAWLKAVTSQGQFKKAMRTMTIDAMAKYGPTVMGNILSLRALNNTKKARQHFINTVLVNENVKEVMVNIIRQVLTTSLTKEAHFHRKYMDHGFKIKKYYNSGHLNIDRMMKDMSQSFFRDDVFEYNKSLIHKYCDGKQDTFSECMEMTRTALMKEATRLFNIRNRGRRSEVLRPVK